MQSSSSAASFSAIFLAAIVTSPTPSWEILHVVTFNYFNFDHPLGWICSLNILWRLTQREQRELWNDFLEVCWNPEHGLLSSIALANTINSLGLSLKYVRKTLLFTFLKLLVCLVAWCIHCHQKTWKHTPQLRQQCQLIDQQIWT